MYIYWYKCSTQHMHICYINTNISLRIDKSRFYSTSANTKIKVFIDAVVYYFAKKTQIP